MRARVARRLKALVVGLSSATTVAWASPPLQDRGSVAVSAERLWGVSREWHRRQVEGGTAIESGITEIGLLTRSGAVLPGAPRLAVDASVFPRLTLGGALGFQRVRTWSEVPAPDRRQTVETRASRWHLSSRVGYALPLGELASLWVRAGVELIRVDRTEELEKALFLCLEPTFIFMPAAHFGFTVTISGQHTVIDDITAATVGPADTNRIEANRKAMGLFFGLLVVF
jgi:hypothetical protein